jgi:drug/metabolite transporter (DMT)-like permease
MSAHSRSLGTMALVATAALWGSNHVVARAAREIVPLPSLVFWRWMLAATALTLIAWPACRSAWPEIRPRLGELVIGGIVGVGLFSYLLLGGAYQSLAIEVGFINATTPMWVLLIGVLTGQRSTEDAIRPQAIGGLALAFFGTVLIITKGHVEAITGLQLNLGNLWSLLAAMAFAWFSLRVREWSPTIAPLPLTVVTGWAGVLFVMLPVYLIWIMSGGAWFSTDSASSAYALITIGYIGLAPTMLGNLFYLFGVATNGPAQAAAFLYLSPLFSAALAVTWLGEEIAWFHFAGVTAILSGLFLVSRTGKKLTP